MIVWDVAICSGIRDIFSLPFSEALDSMGGEASRTSVISAGLKTYHLRERRAYNRSRLILITVIILDCDPTSFYACLVLSTLNSPQLPRPYASIARTINQSTIATPTIHHWTRVPAPRPRPAQPTNHEARLPLLHMHDQ